MADNPLGMERPGTNLPEMTVGPASILRVQFPKGMHHAKRGEWRSKLDDYFGAGQWVEVDQYGQVVDLSH